jgi:predicted P-loop ATPase
MQDSAADIAETNSLSSGEGGGRGRHFRPLDDEQRRYLLMQLQHAGINVPYVSHIQAIVDCGRAQRFNPVVDYLTHLPEWDGEDHIGSLMRRVTSDEFALTLLRRWMVAVVAQALGRMGRYGNCLCPLLISERQGWGKSQFTKLLMPPELMVHYTDTFNLTQEEQCLRKMAQHLLVNLDEFDRHSATGHATLKGLLQLAEIKVKRPHRAQFEEMARLASFIGTSNRRMLLRDRTGSRRYICVELAAPIDVDTPVDHAQLYAQALHLLDGGMRYWLDEEETLRLEEHNAPYKTEHGPEELLTQHFTPVEKKKHYDDDELWTSVAVYDYLHRIDPLLMRSVERTTFGMYVRRMGFEQVRRENKRYFALRAN